MIISLLLVIAQVWFGFEVICRVLNDKTAANFKICFSAPFGITISTFLFFLTSKIFGTNIFHLILHITILCVASSYLYSHRKHNKSITLTRPSRHTIFDIILCISTSLFLILPTYFPDRRSLCIVCI